MPKKSRVGRDKELASESLKHHSIVHIFEPVSCNEDDKSCELLCRDCKRPGNLSLVKAFGRRVLVCTEQCSPFKLGASTTQEETKHRSFPQDSTSRAASPVH
jgi:hypothetical protein